MALNEASFSPGTYWIVNKSTTVTYELRVDYIWVVIPNNTGYSFKVTQNLFTPTTVTDVEINRIADKAVFEGV